MSFEDRIPRDRPANLQRLVTSLVWRRLRDAGGCPTGAVARLRRLEQAAWNAGADRQTLQVITSGRRLLGDGIDLTPGAQGVKPMRTCLAKPMHEAL